MNVANRRIRLVAVVACVVAMSAACGGGSTSDAACTQVSQGNAFMKIVNGSSSAIQVDFGDTISFVADLRAGECNLFGIRLPASYTVRDTVEITQCNFDLENGCVSTFGPTRYESLVLSVGQTVTFTIGPGYFGSSGGSGSTHGISGVVSGAPAGSTVLLSGTSSRSTTTASGGAFSFTNLPDGTYQVTPSVPGYSITPSYRQVTVGGADVTGVTFQATSTGATYSISGSVSGAVADGVTVTLSGAASRTTTTTGGGQFTFSGLPSGSYTITPSLAGFTFSPASRSVALNGQNVGGQSFTASAVGSTHAISGAVSGAVSSGVLVTLSGAASRTTTTSATGTFSFAGLADGTYTVTPSLAGYTFTPPSSQVVVTGADIAGTNFVAVAVVPVTYSISGAVSGAAADGVLITMSGAASRTTTTSGGGLFSFQGLANGTYTLTPSLAGYAFTPTSLQVTVNGANATGVSFIAAALGHTISGNIYGVSYSLVTLTLAGPVSATTNGGSAGSGFAFTGLPNGTYTVTPSGTGYEFAPQSRQVVVQDGNVSGVSFSGKDAGTATYYISGAVTGAATDGVTMTLGGNGSATTSTSGGGTYYFAWAPDGTYTVTPSGTGLTFIPPSQQVTITGGNVTGVNFLAASATHPATWDIAAQYSASQNPNGTWSYGYKTAVTGELTLMTYILVTPTVFWIRANGIWAPSITAPGTYPGPQLYAGQNADGIPAIRWTCPAAGTYRIRMTFVANDGATRTLVAITNGSSTLFSGSVQALGSTATHDGTVTLQTGDPIDFVVSWDTTSPYSPGGWTGITGTITTVMP